MVLDDVLHQSQGMFWQHKYGKYRIASKFAEKLSLARWVHCCLLLGQEPLAMDRSGVVDEH